MIIPILRTKSIPLSKTYNKKCKGKTNDVKPKLFYPFYASVSNFQDMARLLNVVRKDKHAAIVFGKYVNNKTANQFPLYVPGAKGEKLIHRRLHKGLSPDQIEQYKKELREKHPDKEEEWINREAADGFFVSQPTNLIPLDVDDLPVPDDFWNWPQKDQVRYIRKSLPPPFNEAEAVLQFTASYQVSGRCAFRAWFWNKHPLSPSRIKAYIEQWNRQAADNIKQQKALHKNGSEWDPTGTAIIDTATFRVPQLIYTADPVFDNPDCDPFAEPTGRKRWIGLKGVELDLQNTNLPTVTEVERSAPSEPVIAQQNEKLNRLLTALQEHGCSPKQVGHDVWDLEMCPFAEDNHPDDPSGAFVYLRENGNIFLGCQHVSCGGPEVNHYFEVLTKYDLHELDTLPNNWQSALERFRPILSKQAQYFDTETRTVIGSTALMDTFGHVLPDVFEEWRQADKTDYVLAGTVVDITSNDPVVEIDGLRYGNLFKGFAYERLPDPYPVGHEKREKIKQLLTNHFKNLWGEEPVLLGDGREYPIWQAAMGWIGIKLKEPGRKIPWSLLHINAAEGSGRSFLAELLRSILGMSHVPLVRSRDLVGRFNSWIEGAAIAVIEETRLSEGQAETVKELTAGRTVYLERKGKDGIVIPQVCGFMLFSNSADAIEVVGESDRRFLVQIRDFMRDVPLPEKHAYFEPLYGILDDPRAVQTARTVFLEILEDEELSNALSKTYDAPKTPAKKILVDSGKDMFQQVFEENILEYMKKENVAFIGRDQVHRLLRLGLIAGDYYDGFGEAVVEKSLESLERRIVSNRKGGISQLTGLFAVTEPDGRQFRKKIGQSKVTVYTIRSALRYVPKDDTRKEWLDKMVKDIETMDQGIAKLEEIAKLKGYGYLVSQDI